MTHTYEPGSPHMHATEPLTPMPPATVTTPWSEVAHEASLAPSEASTFREMLDDVLPVIGVVFVAGPPVIFLAAPWLLLVLMLSGPFALLVAFVVVGLVAAALLATLAAIVVAPFVIVRRLHRTYRSAHATGVPVPQLAAAPLAAGRGMIARASLRALATWSTADVGYAPMRARGEE
jgi:hypothetical protein